MKVSSDVYTSSTRGRKFQADAAFSGRSMIEMLGVLAIIGVLSVGAITGYSKAMFKYKLNKHAEAMNSLLNDALQTAKLLPCSSPTTTKIITEFFEKLNLLPPGFKMHPKNKNYIIDIFKNSIWIYSNPSNRYGMGYAFDSTQFGHEICASLLTVYKENSSQINFVFVDDYAAAFSYLYGDAHCSSGLDCLKNLTIEDKDTLCNKCVENSCRLYVQWS